MSMRYVIRRTSSEDFSDIRSFIPELDEKLGQAGEHLLRSVAHVVSPMRYATYKFVSKKAGNDWRWACPSIELVGETESDLLALTDSYGVSRSALTHLCS